MNTQPEALRLADFMIDCIEGPLFHVPHYEVREAAAELRRLHEVTLVLAESAEKALEALNSCSEYETHDGEWYDTYDNELVEKAALALRQALARAKEQA